MDLLRARDIATELAYRAGMHIRSKAGRNKSFDTLTKGTNDFVTSVDRRAEEILTDGLLKAFPSSTILAEEATDKVPEELPNAEMLWIIDPIDGTTNFMHGLSPYAVSVGFASRGEIKAGVVYEVSQDDIYTAVCGGGAYMNGRPLQVSDAEDAGDALVSTGFPYRRFDHIEEYMSVLRNFLLNVRGIRRNGAASIDLVRVASGQFDAFYESGLKPWDVAAGMLLVQEAGGKVTDFRGNDNPIMRSQMVATNGRVHDDILELLIPLQNSFS